MIRYCRRSMVPNSGQSDLTSPGPVPSPRAIIPVKRSEALLHFEGCTRRIAVMIRVVERAFQNARIASQYICRSSLMTEHNRSSASEPHEERDHLVRASFSDIREGSDVREQYAHVTLDSASSSKAGHGNPLTNSGER